MSVFQRFVQKPFLPDNCKTYNMNNKYQTKRLTILEYFDASICHHYQPKIKQQRKMSHSKT